MENTRILSQENTYLNRILSEIRDKEIQKDRMRFRTNLERTGEILAYEISKEFSFSTKSINTPLGEANVETPDNDLVICSILRAAIPLHNGLLRIFDHADSGFISAYRAHTDENEFEIKLEYIAAPDLTGKTLILADPMLATGQSMVISYQSLIEEYNEPDQVYIAGVIGSEEGLDYVREKIPHAQVFLGDMDNELTAKYYIVPGLGDAGDLAFGEK